MAIRQVAYFSLPKKKIASIHSIAEKKRSRKVSE
jgi:hypothetical protein